MASTGNYISQDKTSDKTMSSAHAFSLYLLIICACFCPLPDTSKSRTRPPLLFDDRKDEQAFLAESTTHAPQSTLKQRAAHYVENKDWVTPRVATVNFP